jgi:hypothetical protein
MDPSLILAGVIWLLTIYAWGSAAVLIRVARNRPRVGALTERALVATIIAIFGTAYSLILVNSELIHVADTDTAVLFVRCAVIVLLTIPAWWSWMLLSGRLTRTGSE